jgi:colanic acid/amylovoran biosynthesis glycosyltransferase
MRVGYLVNQYPKNSHSFVRREIHALERQGIEVERFSVRAAREQLRDDADRAEQNSTRVVLGAGPLRLMSSLLTQLASGPRRALRASRLAWRMGRRSERGLLIHAIYLAEASLLFRWLKQQGCAHLHAHFGTNPATVAMLCRELGGPPFSFTVHGPEEFDKPSSIGLGAKIERASFVAAICSYGKSQLYRLCDRSHWNKIHVVHCGVDAGFLKQPPTPIPCIPRLVCVGRLCEQKGQLLLIDAAARLVAEGIQPEIVLVGDGEMRSEVEKKIAELGLGGRVRITGWADERQVRDELRSARALVLPSFAEGLPVVIMEALAMGRPVISTYVAGIPELVVNGECGWLVPAGDVDALAAAMKSALSADTDELERMGIAGRAHVLAHFDVDGSASELRKLLDRALGEDSAATAIGKRKLR